MCSRYFIGSWVTVKLSLCRSDIITGGIKVLELVFWHRPSGRNPLAHWRSPDNRGGALPQRTKGEAWVWPEDFGEVPLAYDDPVALQRLYMVRRDSYHMSLKGGARLGPRWSSVCVGVDSRHRGLKADLPTRDALGVRAARVSCRGGACCLCAGSLEVCGQLPVWLERCMSESCLGTS